MSEVIIFKELISSNDSFFLRCTGEPLSDIVQVRGNSNGVESKPPELPFPEEIDVKIASP